MAGGRGRKRLVLRASADAPSWDELVTVHPAATAFHLHAFLHTAGRMLGLEVHLTVAEVAGEVVGVVPLLVRSRGPFALVNDRLPFPYLGPLLPPDFSLPAVRDAICDYLRPRRVLYLDLQSTRPLPVPAYAGRGWEQPDGDASGVVPLGGKDGDALLDLYSTNQRASYRRAVKRGLVAGPATRQEVMDYFPTWSEESFARQGLRPPWPRGTQLAVYDRLTPAGVCVATAVRQGGETLAVSVDLVLQKRMYAWELAMSSEGRTIGAAQVLYLSLFRTARGRALEELDLLGLPTPGIANFKKGLGAEFRPRAVARWRSPLLPWGERMRGLMPARAAR